MERADSASKLFRMDRRQLIGGLAAGTLLGRGTAAWAMSDPYVKYVHPELRAFYDKMSAMVGASAQPLSAATLKAARAQSGRWLQPRRSDVPVEKRLIAGIKGQPDVAIYIVNAKKADARPAILHMHGGGYVLLSPENDMRSLQDLCAELDCVAVSVDYRLAPETTYLGSIEDNYAGLKWLHDNAADIGADPAKIALLGGSAGGGHAALLAITARDRGEVPVIFQCLTYPMLDDRTGTTRQVPPHVGRFIWDAQKNHFGWKSFLGMEPGGRNVPSRAVPARLTDMKGLPPGWIGVGTLDLFFDEDVDYAQRLNDAGVPTELIVVPGAWHAFELGSASDPNVKISGWFETAKKNALRRAFGIPVV